MFIVACCDGTGVFEFIEEMLNGIALLVNPVAEGRLVETIGHGANISPSSTFNEPFAKGVGVISPIRQENLQI